MMTRTLRKMLSVAIISSAMLMFSGLSVASSPEAGERGRYRAECRRLTKQINHFEYTILPMAIERNNRGWERATNEQVERLWHRRADLCPKYGKERTMMARAADRARKINKAISVAARAAATYFTGGLGGVVP